jgi:fumarate reductase flavoprotein subunit
MFVINKEMCVCCHNCADECPRQAIDFVGTKYEIDQEKCVKCGLCEKVCHSGACQQFPKKNTVQQHDLIERQADLVVVGSGCGLVSAVYAAQQGKKVLLLEKSTKIGGNTDYAHGYMPQYSKWHASMGFADERESAVEHFYQVGEGQIEKELIHAAVYGASDFFDWLCTLCDITETYDLHAASENDFHGPMFGNSVVEFKERYLKNLNCRDDAIGPGWGGTHVIQTMLDTIEKENLDVTILLGTAAEHILLDENGAVKGLMAKDDGGQVKIDCKTIMLACGGFGQNDELLKKYCHVDFFSSKIPMHRFSVPGDTGDAISMMAELGEEPDPNRMFVSIWGPRHHPFNNSIADYAQEGEFPEINLNGKRWYDESEAIFHGIAKIYQQPEHISYTIMPYQQVKTVAERYMNTPAMANRAKYFATWEEDLDHEATLDTPVKKADTLYELAQKMNVDPDVFVEEMTRYSHFCETGVDEDFHKDAHFLKKFPLNEGPYYAVFGQCFSEAAMGGVRVNDQCEVIRKDGSQIPGLYAGGDCTSSMHRKGKMAPISELTWAVASNYIAAGNMVRYIDEKEREDA